MIESFIIRARSRWLSGSYLVPLTSYLVMLLSLSGCEEPGEKIESLTASSLQFKTRVADPLDFKVYINNDLFDPGKPFIKYYANSVSLRVTEAISERVIYNGPFPVRRTQTSAYLTVYQYSAGSVPVCIMPSQEEPLPPAGYGKIAFLYNFPDFPDEVKAVVENSTTPASFTFVPTDTLIVRKNEFSGFFPGRFPGSKTQIKLYTTDDRSTLLGTIGAGEMSLINRDFTMYLTNQKSGGTNPQISLERAY